MKSTCLLWLLGVGLLQAGERTILLVDDQDVLYRPGTIRKVVQLNRHSPDPVIPPDKPWEAMLGWTSVHRDAETGKHQLWYQAYQERRVEDKVMKNVVCYAESMDGITWTKPNLGLFPFYEEKDTNIVLIGERGGYGERYCNSVVVDERDSDPKKRYKMAYYDWVPAEGEKGGSGTHVAFSPDGVHWTKYDGGIVSKASFGSKGREAPFADESVYVEEHLPDGRVRRAWRNPMSMSDALDVFYDPRLERFVGYGKMWTPWQDGTLGYKHAMGRMESQDFIHWSKPELILTVNDRDAPQLEFHTSPVFFYNGMYLSMNQILDRSVGSMDAELMSSRDGRRWDRSLAGCFAIPRGEPGSFDAGSIITNGTPVILEKEMRFYYGGYRGTAIGGVGLNEQKVGGKDYHSGVGLATTPRDRLAAISINPESPVKAQKKDKPKIINTIGHVTLKPQDLSGVKAVTLNADASKGRVRLEILNEDGYRLHGFTKDEAVPLKGDSLAHAPRWKDKQISDLPPGRYMLRIHLEKADLFALTLK
ncbi:MAG: hypothetical protein V4662_18605 [Verrucomicrobiota bacterium]